MWPSKAANGAGFRLDLANGTAIIHISLTLEVQPIHLGGCCMGKRYQQLSLLERVCIQAQLELGFKAAQLPPP
jgi:hypothetical protein